MLRIVLTRGVTRIETDLSLGLVAACGMSRPLSSLVYNLRPNDPSAFCRNNVHRQEWYCMIPDGGTDGEMAAAACNLRDQHLGLAA